MSQPRWAASGGLTHCAVTPVPPRAAQSPCETLSEMKLHNQEHTSPHQQGWGVVPTTTISKLRATLQDHVCPQTAGLVIFQVLVALWYLCFSKLYQVLSAHRNPLFSCHLLLGRAGSSCANDLLSWVSGPLHLCSLKPSLPHVMMSVSQVIRGSESWGVFFALQAH